jgi:glycine cleavage system H protein
MKNATENPVEFFYTKDHEWISYKKTDNFCYIGITNYAQEQLGDVVFIDLKEDDKIFNIGEVLGEIESVKSVSDIIAPISGKIIEKNNSIVTSPEIINHDPYNKGWILKYKIENFKELKLLLNKKEYEKYTNDLA